MRLGGSISQSKQTVLGIPQREVFSVTIFLVAINGMLEELGNEMGGSLFADDLAIYITIRSQRVPSKALQGVTFSPRKTVSMAFRNRRKRNEKSIEIMLRNEIIPSKENTQFWGMTLGSRLNWEEYIKKLRTKEKNH